MKKLIILCIAVFVFNSTGQCQVEDTLRYFLKKQLYKAPPSPPNTLHPMFKLLAGTIINTGFSHVGSIFKNNSPVAVVGLEARVMTPTFVVTPTGLPVRLYLANVVNGLPVFPLLDSTNVLNANEPINNVPVNYAGQLIGGNLAHGTKTVTGDFAVLIRCTSLSEGDAIWVFRTSGYKPTANVPASNGYRFGDGCGVVRYQFQFSGTRDFLHPDFGDETDYEFCVAPRVKYDLEISQAESPIQYGACCWQPFTNTNTSTSAWTSPQFNFTEFHNHLKPFNNLYPAGMAASLDTSLVWSIGDGSPAMLPTPLSNKVDLGIYGGQCNMFHVGNIHGNFKKMAPDNPESTTYTAMTTFTSSTVWCNDAVGTGISELKNLANISVYPNPVVDRIKLSGLEGNNRILIYTITGDLIFSKQTDGEELTFDFSDQAVGNYLIRIIDPAYQSRVVKILKE